MLISLNEYVLEVPMRLRGMKRVEVMLELFSKLNVNSQEIDCIQGCKYTGGQRSFCSFSEGSVLSVGSKFGLFQHLQLLPSNESGEKKIQTKQRRQSLFCRSR